MSLLFSCRHLQLKVIAIPDSTLHWVDSNHSACAILGLPGCNMGDHNTIISGFFLRPWNKNPRLEVPTAPEIFALTSLVPTQHGINRSNKYYYR